MPPKTGYEVKEKTVRFDARSAKIWFGSKMYKVLSEDFEDEFRILYKGANLKEKLDIIKLFCSTFFPKEVAEKTDDPFADWSDEELKNFTEHGIRPKGKVIYVGEHK